MRVLAILLGLMMTGLAFAETPMKQVTYAELGKLVRSFRGKPLVVYIWHSG